MDDEILRAKKKAMYLLERNDRTEWELNDKLVQNGFSQEAIAEAVAYVKSYHYIDDKRYAVKFVETFCDRRSIRRIRQDLYKRHVPEEYINLAIENIDGDDSVALDREAEKLLRGVDDLSAITYDEKQKLAAKLYRKGFRMGDIIRRLDMN